VSCAGGLSTWSLLGATMAISAPGCPLAPAVATDRVLDAAAALWPPGRGGGAAADACRAVAARIAARQRGRAEGEIRSLPDEGSLQWCLLGAQAGACRSACAAVLARVACMAANT
jgi:hypothetical protein